MSYNKVVYGGKTIIDLTGDTATEDKVLSGATFHDKSGETVTGTCTYDADTKDATVAVAEMISGKTAYARGAKLTGTMPNNGAVSGTIKAKGGSYTVPMGFHDGSGKVAIDATESAKLVAGNIKSGVTVLGVTGTYTGAAITAQSKEVTPSASAQTIQPDSGYNYLSSVTVKAIPYTESQNAAGGTTVTIGG